MDDLEAIRQRRLQELQERQAQLGAQQSEENAQAAAQEAAMERILQQILNPEARERLTRIRMSRPELADMVTKQLVVAAQKGAITQQMDDAQLKALLQRLMPQDREPKITRK